MFRSQDRRHPRGRRMSDSAKRRVSRPLVEELESRQLLSGLGLGLGRLEAPGQVTVTVVSLTVSLDGQPGRGLGEIMRGAEHGPFARLGTTGGDTTGGAAEIARGQGLFQRLSALEERAVAPANEITGQAPTPITRVERLFSPEALNRAITEVVESSPVTAPVAPTPLTPVVSVVTGQQRTPTVSPGNPTTPTLDLPMVQQPGQPATITVPTTVSAATSAVVPTTISPLLTRGSDGTLLAAQPTAEPQTGTVIAADQGAAQPLTPALNRTINFGVAQPPEAPAENPQVPQEDATNPDLPALPEPAVPADLPAGLLPNLTISSLLADPLGMLIALFMSMGMWMSARSNERKLRALGLGKKDAAGAPAH